MSTSKKDAPTDRYHHGDLRRALVDQALMLLAESGDGGDIIFNLSYAVLSSVSIIPPLPKGRCFLN